MQIWAGFPTAQHTEGGLLMKHRESSEQDDGSNAKDFTVGDLKKMSTRTEIL